MKYKAVFLDRDDTLIASAGNHPINTPEEMVLLNTVPQGLKMLKDAGFLLIMVSNQGGIDLGYLTRKTMVEMNGQLNKLLNKAGGPKIDGFYWCPHRPDSGCECRKPKPGMLFSAANERKINLRHSYMVGDQRGDMQAGQAAGVRACIKMGRGKFQQGDFFETDVLAPNMIRAAEAILEIEKL